MRSQRPPSKCSDSRLASGESCGFAYGVTQSNSGIVLLAGGRVCCWLLQKVRSCRGIGRALAPRREHVALCRARPRPAATRQPVPLQIREQQSGLQANLAQRLPLFSPALRSGPHIVGEDRRGEGIVGVQDRERAATRLGQRRTVRPIGGTGGSSRGGQHDSIGSHERRDLQEVRQVLLIHD